MQGRMSGQAFLLTFAATGKSETPNRAERMPQLITLIVVTIKIQQRITNPCHRAKPLKPMAPQIHEFLLGKDQASRSTFRYNGAIQPTWSRCN
jgi:hypothetical protein